MSNILIQMLVRTGLWTGFLGIVLFGAAGSLSWPAGWAFVAIGAAAAVAMGVVLARDDPGLLAERLAAPFQPDQAAWDRLVLAGAMVAWLGWIVLMALDA